MCNIQNIEDLFKAGHKYCDGMAIWYCKSDGLENGWDSWVGRLEAEKYAIQRLFGDDWPGEAVALAAADRPPQKSSLFRVTPLPRNPRSRQEQDKNFRLRYFYVHGNPDNAQGAPTEQVAAMTCDALARLDSMGCRSIGMNGILGCGVDGIHDEHIDWEHDQLLRDSIRQWWRSPARNCIEIIYLVDASISDDGPAP